MRKNLLLTLFLGVTFAASADVSLPHIFSDHMVIQRDKPIQVWGWAAPGENVKVELASVSQTVKTGKDGKWKIALPQMSAGGPYTLTVTGKNTMQFTDVMIGEVWLCGGQSNMEWPLSSAMNAKQEISDANYPMIRQIKVPRTSELSPKDDIKDASWETCTPATAANFTAVGYFYARELLKELNVAIGLINSNWGGTNVETWISNASFFGHPEFAALKSKMPVSFDSLMNSQRQTMETLIRNQQGSLPVAGEERQFATASFNDAQWKTMKLPTAWEYAGLPEVDGIVWFRKSFNLTANATGRVTLYLGPIDDIDSTYINGVYVGSTYEYNVPREYAIPASVLKAGVNTIAVKVIDNQGGGGLYGTPGQMKLRIGETELPLNGNWQYRIAKVLPPNGVNPNQYPTLLYNGMIHPLINYAIAGAIWYQGESNAGRAMQYKTSFPLMIEDWRKQWKDNFPFYFVQLTSYNSANGSNSTGGSNWAELREAQTETLRLPNTGMAVIVDVGESKDIHPKNKQDVGKRLAAIALAKTYKRERVYSGPVFQSMQVQGNKALLLFTNVASGFVVKNKYGYINGFEVAGADQKFYYAKAFVEGDKIVVYSDAVTQPVAVRYAWADDPNDVNLFNKEGFPAAPFRTDKWKAKTEGAKYEIQ
ncbi:MAG TPA: sialate O-acetylesterase [Chitinophagaceae bacterium]